MRGRLASPPAPWRASTLKNSARPSRRLARRAAAGAPRRRRAAAEPQPSRRPSLAHAQPLPVAALAQPALGGMDAPKGARASGELSGAPCVFTNNVIMSPCSLCSFCSYVCEAAMCKLQEREAYASRLTLYTNPGREPGSGKPETETPVEESCLRVSRTP